MNRTEVSTLADITPERIANDVVGYTVDVTALDGQTPPVQWTFDADEVRHVEILTGEVTSNMATITVLMTTKSNPQLEQEVLELSGNLKLQYERRDAQWVLARIENLTFHYRVGVRSSV